MMSISNYAENKLLDAVGGTSFSVTTAYLQLHLGDPGEDGTANAAGESTRKSCAFDAAASGSMASSATVEWTNVSATETYSHWSLWDAASAGNCLWSGALASSAAVTAGDTFQITSLTLTLD
jgi:hypothetical protein